MSRHFAYWNLHRGAYSLRNTSTGRVDSRVASAVLDRVTLAVGQSGRARVLLEGVKNVHAGVRGEVSATSEVGGGAWPQEAADILQPWVGVTYNPLKHSTFVRRDTGEPVHSAAQAVLLTRDGKPAVYVTGIRRTERGWEATS